MLHSETNIIVFLEVLLTVTSLLLINTILYFCTVWMVYTAICKLDFQGQWAFSFRLLWNGFLLSGTVVTGNPFPSVQITLRRGEQALNSTYDSRCIWQIVFISMGSGKCTRCGVTSLHMSFCTKDNVCCNPICDTMDKSFSLGGYITASWQANLTFFVKVSLPGLFAKRNLSERIWCNLCFLV